MINLLPPNARKQVQIEYWVRVSSVWILLLGLAFIMISFLLVPSLILVQSQLAVYDGEYQNASSQNDVYENLEQEVRVANGIAAQLINSDTDALFSALLSEVENIAGTSVVLEAISFSRVEGKVESIQITGDAPSRATLVQFRDSLEESSLFESAALPLSNLAKDKDVPFSITILVSNQLQE